MYKGFELVKVCEYHVWKDGLHLFVGSFKECRKFLEENSTGWRPKARKEVSK